MSILFTPFQVSQIPASAPQSRALEVYKKTVLPEMPQRVRAHRAARRVRDGVTVRPFRLPEPSATCRRTAPLCLTLTCSFLFVDAFKHPCVSAGTAVLPPTQSSTTSEESDGKRPHPAPGPGTVCRSASQAGGSRPLRRSLHSAVGLMRASVQPLPPSAHAAFARRLGREARWFSS